MDVIEVLTVLSLWLNFTSIIRAFGMTRQRNKWGDSALITLMDSKQLTSKMSVAYV